MASVTDICNRALQKVGAHAITSLTDTSVNARACNLLYETVRDALISDYRWNFAIQRFQLAPSATAPAFGPANFFPLPTGCLKVLSPDPKWNYNDRDWVLEGQSIASSDGWQTGAAVGGVIAPVLNVKCVMQITDAGVYPAIFREALACKLAMELCEPLTQSNTKYEKCATQFKNEIAKASRQNAIQNVPQEAAEDVFITARG